MMGMIDLSYYRRKEFTLANLSYSDINEELLNECAYYPLPINPFQSTETQCNKCSMSKPNTSCKYSHILSLTDIKVKERKIKGKGLELGDLSTKDIRELIEFVRERRKINDLHR